MLPGFNNYVPAYRPLLEMLDAVLLTSKEVGAHLRYSEESLSLMRRRGKGPPWIKLPTGGVRYRLSEVAAWQLQAERGEVTLDRVALAMAGCATVPIEYRAAMIDHVRQAIIAPPARTNGDHIPAWRAETPHRQPKPTAGIAS